LNLFLIQYIKISKNIFSDAGIWLSAKTQHMKQMALTEKNKMLAIAFNVLCL
jgi:hypothetical protein